VVYRVSICRFLIKILFPFIHNRNVSLSIALSNLVFGGMLPTATVRAAAVSSRLNSEEYLIFLCFVVLNPSGTVHITVTELCDERFDKSDRLFWPVDRSWENVTSITPGCIYIRNYTVWN
jgi:hypothetical protein